MKEDSKITKEVNAALQWESRINGAAIKTNVSDGHVVLSGTVNSYPKKIAAEVAIRRVAGVKSISNEITVVIPKELKRDDREIAATLKDIIKWNSNIDESKIQITVDNGWVTLEGNVEWDYQRSKARLLAEDINGVAGVTNLIAIVNSLPTSEDVHNKIMDALERHYNLKGDKIHVTVEGSKVALSGMVHNLEEKYVAEEAAWSAPGITEVENTLEIATEEIYS